MKEFFEGDFFAALAGVVSTIAAFVFAKFLGRAKILSFMPPIIVSSLIIILAVENSSATYEGYAKGGDLIVYLLYPATVALRDGSFFTVFYAHRTQGEPATILGQKWRFV